MISREDIVKLADLARLDLREEEIDNLRGEMDAILGYVETVQKFNTDVLKEDESSGVDIGPVFNVMREDENPTESGTYSQALIAEFPEKEGDYLKVKKILG